MKRPEAAWGANGRELFYVQNVETDYAQPGSGRQARKLDELKRLVPAK